MNSEQQNFGSPRSHHKKWLLNLVRRRSRKKLRIRPARSHLIEPSRQNDGEFLDQKRLRIPEEVTENFWEDVYFKMVSDPGTRRSRPARLFSTPRPVLLWSVLCVVILCLGIVYLISTDRKSLQTPLLDKSSFQITIQSATIQGKNAGISIFRMEDPEMTFLWLEPNEPLNGG